MPGSQGPTRPGARLASGGWRRRRHWRLTTPRLVEEGSEKDRGGAAEQGSQPAGRHPPRRHQDFGSTALAGTGARRWRRSRHPLRFRVGRRSWGSGTCGCASCGGRRRRSCRPAAGGSGAGCWSGHAEVRLFRRHRGWELRLHAGGVRAATTPQETAQAAADSWHQCWGRHRPPPYDRAIGREHRW